MKTKKTNWHPSRVKGSVKFGRMLEINRDMEKKTKLSHRRYKHRDLDLTKSDWSMK